MKKHVIALAAVVVVVVVAGAGNAHAGNARGNLGGAAQPGTVPSFPARAAAKPSRPTGKMLRECDGDGICTYWDCYETDSQSVCDMITWCNPGGACWPT